MSRRLTLAFPLRVSVVRGRRPDLLVTLGSTAGAVNGQFHRLVDNLWIDLCMSDECGGDPHPNAG